MSCSTMKIVAEFAPLLQQCSSSTDKRKTKERKRHIAGNLSTMNASPDSLNSSLRWLRTLQQPEFSDVLFEVSGEYVSANRFVLGSSSSYFREILFNSTDTARPTVVPLVDVSAPAFRSFVELCYDPSSVHLTGLNAGILQEIVILAKRFGLPTICNLIDGLSSIQLGIDVKSVAGWLNLSFRLSLKN